MALKLRMDMEALLVFRQIGIDAGWMLFENQI
jgi:hypothetical protein